MKRVLTYATVCSGIECMSVACRGLPLKPVFFSEIEPFPCAVLKANYPTIPNLGDMSKIRRDENGNITNGTTTIPFPDGGIDILAAGCPCTDFSVAGKRAGGAEGSGTRSSLVFEFIRLIGEIRPRWFIYENVVGMLSTNEGRDFAHILLAFRDCGYSVAYRTLDAQYVRVDGMERAVPQRRRRVWVVGCLGADESRAAEILFEPDCVAGHTAPRRRAGEGFAYSLAGRDRVDARLVGGARSLGINNQGGAAPQFSNEHAETITAATNSSGNNVCGCAIALDGGCLNPLDVQSKRIYQPSGIAPCLPSGGTEGMTIQPSVCIALDGDKLKPREDQRKGGNGFGINEEGADYTLTGVDRHGVAYGIDQQGGKGGANTTEGVAPTVLSDSHGTPHGVAYSGAVGGGGKDDVSEVLTARSYKGIGARNGEISGAFAAAKVQYYDMTHADDPGRKVADGVLPTLQSRMGTGGNQVPLTVSMAQNTRDEVRIIGGDGQIAGALPAEPGMKQQTYIVSTNSNGEDIAPTLNANMSKLGGDNQTTFGGGGVLHHTANRCMRKDKS